MARMRVSFVGKPDVQPALGKDVTLNGVTGHFLTVHVSESLPSGGFTAKVVRKSENFDVAIGSLGELTPNREFHRAGTNQWNWRAF